jgi:hypothetical protein
MRKQLAIGGLVAIAAVAGTTGVAIAHAAGQSPTSAATAAPTGTATAPSGTATKGAKAAKGANGGKATKGGDRAGARAILGKLKDFQHAEWVTKGDANAYVTHEAILGTVQAVSASSITVKAADGTSMTFAVDAKTTVHQPKAGKGATATKDPNAPAPTIADVKSGQSVLVGGAKTPDLTAKNVLVRAG